MKLPAHSVEEAIACPHVDEECCVRPGWSAVVVSRGVDDDEFASEVRRPTRKSPSPRECQGARKNIEALRNHPNFTCLLQYASHVRSHPANHAQTTENSYSHFRKLIDAEMLVYSVRSDCMAFGC